MTKTDGYLFASYSLKDRGTVVPFIEKLKAHGVNIFYDASLKPGEDWAGALAVALNRAAGLLTFVSPRSMQSESVLREIAAGIGPGGKLVIPILLEALEHTEDLPSELRRRQWVDLSGERARPAWIRPLSGSRSYSEACSPCHRARRLASVRRLRRASRSSLPTSARSSGRPEATSPPDSVFVVHGHDAKLLEEVEVYIKEMWGAPQNLVQRI